MTYFALQNKKRWKAPGLHSLSAPFALWILIVCVIALAPGCAKFRPTKRVNLAPFADQTIALLGQHEYSFAQDTRFLTREFIDAQAPAFQSLNQGYNDIATLFRSVMVYSINIVTLSESRKTETEKVRAFADYLETLRSTVMKRPGVQITESEYREMLDAVRTEDTFLDALNAAQPLINEAARYGSTLTDDVERSGAQLAMTIQEKIDAEYAHILDFLKVINDRKKSLLLGIQLLEDYQAGDRTAIERLRKSKVVRSKVLLPRGRLTDKQMTAIENYLLDRLKKIQKLRQEVAPDIADWEAVHKELDALLIDHLETTRRARIAIIVWSRAHQKMAMGIENPAEWFDVSAAPGQLMSIGTKAIIR